MDEYQALTAIKAKLIARRWGGDEEAEPVWGNASGTDGVVITSGFVDQTLPDVIFPLVLLSPGGGQIDPRIPGLVDVTFKAKLLVAIEGRETGEQALMSGPRARGDDASPGAGLLLLQRELYATLLLQSVSDGIYVQLVTQGPAISAFFANDTFVAFREYTFKARLTTQPTTQPTEE